MKQSIKTIILSTICKCLHFLFLPFLDGFVNRRTFYAFPYKINDDIQYLLTVCPMTSSKLRHSRGAIYCIIQYLTSIDCLPNAPEKPVSGNVRKRLAKKLMFFSSKDCNPREPTKTIEQHFISKNSCKSPRGPQQKQGTLATHAFSTGGRSKHGNYLSIYLGSLPPKSAQ